MNLKSISNDLSVTPQLLADDIADVAELGFGKVINNRPDGEQMGQPSSAELQAACEKYGIQYAHIPIIPGQVDADSVSKFAAALGSTDKPAVAFCKTGTRAMILWALTQKESNDVNAVLRKAGEAGFDLVKMRPTLEQVYADRAS